MSLLKIVEPDQNHSSNNDKTAIGIDLGTTNTLVATVRDSKPEVLSDKENNYKIPSIVYYRKSSPPLVGYDALDAMLDDHANAIVSVKRLMGRGNEDVKRLTDLFGYQLTNNHSQVPKIKTIAGDKTAIEVSADILRKCSERTENILGVDQIDGAVITVPAYFDDAQRQATKDAARLAGINVYRLINEPTAAAIAYGLDRRPEGEVVVVFDLGGGTFDISILRIDKEILQVIATGGDTRLGGDDFDRMVADYFAQALPEDFQSDAKERRYLLNLARVAKETVCSQNKTFRKELKTLDGVVWQAELSYDTFSKLIQPLIEDISRVCKEVLSDSGIQVDAIDEVVLVGGSTRIPLVKQCAAEVFKCKPFDEYDPDKVVAIGAAIQADTLSGNNGIYDSLLLLDVVPLSLGVETMGGLVEKIIPRNSSIPTVKTQEFTTAKDGQTSIFFHVVQGERDLVDDCQSLARFELKNLPPRIAGEVRVKVIFTVDADGLLTVEAKEATSGMQAMVEVKPTYGLSDDDITEIIRASVEYAKEDVEARNYKEKQVDAERVLDALNASLEKDGERLLNDDEMDTIITAKDNLKMHLDTGSDYNTLEQAVKDLESCSEFYVERRMNEGIRSVLQGHNVNEIK